MFPEPSVGVALDNVEIRIGDLDVEEVAGEVFIRSNSNCLGYYNRAVLNTAGEWLGTGDLGYYKIFNDRRYFYLTGRIKEVINRGGEKISPLELESELYKAGLNIEYAVISIPSEKYGEDVGLACTKPFDFSLLQEIPT